MGSAPARATSEFGVFDLVAVVVGIVFSAALLRPTSETTRAQGSMTHPLVVLPERA